VGGIRIFSRVSDSSKAPNSGMPTGVVRFVVEIRPRRFHLDAAVQTS
jgi:hypothetical protein